MTILQFRLLYLVILLHKAFKNENVDAIHKVGALDEWLHLYTTKPQVMLLSKGKLQDFKDLEILKAKRYAHFIPY